jgi:hypothetical protein
LALLALSIDQETLLEETLRLVSISGKVQATA